MPSSISIEYDHYDRLVHVIDPLGNRDIRGYDANHNLVLKRTEGEIEDVGGDAQNVRLFEGSYAYDAVDRRTMQSYEFFDTETQAPLQGGQLLGKALTRYEYTDRSMLSRMENDNQHETLYAYDSVGRLFRMTDARGNTFEYAYDENDNLLTMTEIEISDLGPPDETYVTTYVYDELDRVTSKTDNISNTLTRAYNSRHNVGYTVDALGNTITFDYDSVDRLVTTTRVLTDDGTGSGNPIDTIVTHQTWDDSWRLTGQIDHNTNLTAYEYDSLDRQTLLIYGDGTQDAYEYDARDNITRIVDANGSVVDQVHDLRDRRTRVDVAPGLGVSLDTTFEDYAWDGLSRMARAVDDDSLATFSYDSLSNVLEETLQSQSVTSTFDGLGNRESCVYPGGRTFVSTYDVLERLSTITDTGSAIQIAAYDYVGPWRVQQKTLGNGVVGDFTWDGLPGSQPPGDFGEREIVGTAWVLDPQGVNTPVDERTYTWDRMGNKTSREDIRASGPAVHAHVRVRLGLPTHSDHRHGPRAHDHARRAVHARRRAQPGTGDRRPSTRWLLDGPHTARARRLPGQPVHNDIV